MAEVKMKTLETLTNESVDNLLVYLCTAGMYITPLGAVITPYTDGKDVYTFGDRIHVGHVSVSLVTNTYGIVRMIEDGDSRDYFSLLRRANVFDTQYKVYDFAEKNELEVWVNEVGANCAGCVKYYGVGDNYHYYAINDCIVIKNPNGTIFKRNDVWYRNSGDISAFDCLQVLQEDIMRKVPHTLPRRCLLEYMSVFGRTPKDKDTYLNDAVYSMHVHEDGSLCAIPDDIREKATKTFESLRVTDKDSMRHFNYWWDGELSKCKEVIFDNPIYRKYVANDGHVVVAWYDGTVIIVKDADDDTSMIIYHRFHYKEQLYSIGTAKILKDMHAVRSPETVDLTNLADALVEYTRRNCVCHDTVVMDVCCTLAPVLRGHITDVDSLCRFLKESK